MVVALRGRLLHRLPHHQRLRLRVLPKRHVVLVSEPGSHQSLKMGRPTRAQRLTGEAQERTIGSFSVAVQATPVRALRLGEDAAVAGGSNGPQDAVQRVWGPIQVWSARARVPTRGKPNVRADSALQLAPEGSGAPSPERGFTAAATRRATPAEAAILSSPG